MSNQIKMDDYYFFQSMLSKSRKRRRSLIDDDITFPNDEEDEDALLLEMVEVVGTLEGQKPPRKISYTKLVCFISQHFCKYI